MAQTYDPLVLRLWLLEGTPAVKVYYRDGSVKMRKVRKRPEEGAKLNEYWDSRVADALHRDGELLVSLRGGDYFLTPTVAMKPLQEGKLVHLLTTKTETIGVYTFGDLLTSDRPGLAKALFGDITSYTIGQALLWDVAQQKAQKLPRRKKISREEFHPEDFSAIGPHYIYKRGACGMAFFHRDLGFFKGLKDLKEEFPTATTTEVRELYSSFGYTPSSSIAKVFKSPPKKEKKEQYSDYYEGEGRFSGESIPMDDRPLRIPEPYQPLNEEIQPPDKKVLWGYIHATGLYPRRGKVMGSNPIHVGDIPIKNEKELKKFLKQWRYSIDDKLLHKLWNFVLEGNGEQQ